MEVMLNETHAGVYNISLNPSPTQFKTDCKSDRRNGIGIRFGRDGSPPPFGRCTELNRRHSTNLSGALCTQSIYVFYEHIIKVR